MNRRIISAVVAILLLAGSSTAALAKDKDQDQGPATDLFVGAATTGVGAPSPVDVNPGNIKVTSLGIGLGYTYKASGNARGDVPGTFTYEEHGYLFFTNPADPTTFAGSEFDSGVFTIDPRKHGEANIVIADTNPAAYTHGVSTAHLGHGAAVEKIEKRLGMKTDKGSVTYGYFTFTDQFGTFTGYATPDFRQFAISIQFAR